MKLIKTYKAAAAILHHQDGRALREIAEHKAEIIELIEEKALYTLTGKEALVAQMSGPEGENLYAYELVDLYLSCDTDSELMTEEETKSFLRLGGEIRY